MIWLATALAAPQPAWVGTPRYDDQHGIVGTMLSDPQAPRIPVYRGSLIELQLVDDPQVVTLIVLGDVQPASLAMLGARLTAPTHPVGIHDLRSGTSQVFTRDPDALKRYLEGLADSQPTAEADPLLLRPALVDLERGTSDAIALRQVWLVTDTPPADDAEEARSRLQEMGAVLDVVGPATTRAQLEPLVDGTDGGWFDIEAAFPTLEQRLDRLQQFRVDVCGEPGELSIDFGGRSLSARPTGSSRPCGAADRVEDLRQHVPARITGLLCLVGMGLGMGVFFAGIFWLVRRRNADPRPSTAPSEPEPRRTVAPAEKSPEPKPEAPKPPPARLIVVGGEAPLGTSWPFEGRMLRIGAVQEDNDIVVELPQVSGQHAVFELLSGDRLLVKDLGSANGTWVDGERLPPNVPTQVGEGQQIALSSQLMLTFRRS